MLGCAIHVYTLCPTHPKEYFLSYRLNETSSVYFAHYYTPLQMSEFKYISKMIGQSV